MNTQPPGHAPFSDVIRQVRRSRSAVRVLPPGPPGLKPAHHPPLRGPAAHGTVELAICCSGRMTFVGATRLFDLRRGDVVIIPPGAWHYESYCQPSQPYRFCWIVTTPGQLRCNFSTYSRGRLDVYWLPGVFPGAPYNARCERLLRLARGPGPVAGSRTRRLVLDLLLELRRNAAALGPPPAPVAFSPPEKLVKLMEARFREPLQIRALAREVGLSPNYLSGRFRRIFGTTFKNYLNVLRVWHAQRLLEGGRPIKQVAVECGFRNVYYFTAVFTGKCRMTPGVYRRRAGYQ